MRVHFARFVAVGWMGFAVQSLAFVVLTSAALLPWLPAAIIAAEFSVVHNFLWHERWTWKARRAGDDPAVRDADHQPRRARVDGSHPRFAARAAARPVIASHNTR